ncbi:MAG: hypothetical protein HDR80_05520 [Bacteroides sp.]|nr:hypothetical protein [Bacteroides sp.]
MKKLLLMLMLAIATTMAAFAHPAPDGKGGAKEMFHKIREYKIKFLAQEMELKNDQKERFAKLYAEMSAERMKIWSPVRALEKKVGKDASEEEYAKVSKAISDARVRDAALDQEYDRKFAEFLTQKQIFKMKEASEKFKRKMEEMHRSKKKGCQRHSEGK